MHALQTIGLKTVYSTFIAALLLTLGSAEGVTPPFTEHFENDVADWRDAGSFPLNFVAAGGSDASSYVSTDFAPNSGGGAGGTDAVLFRGHDEFGDSGSSGGAFVGNWIDGGVRRLTAFVRHNAPLPLNYFFRGSSPFNFPGASAVQFQPVAPNVWTEIEFDTSAASSQFVTFEGADYETVFSNIGHVQFGVTIPDSLSNDSNSYTFDLDQVSISTPEPATLTLLGSTLAGACIRLRRRGPRGGRRQRSYFVVAPRRTAQCRAQPMRGE